MRHIRIIVLLSAGFTLCNLSAHAQGLGGRFMFGFGAGTQQLYSDLKSTGFGVGGEGLLGYRLNDRLGVTLAAGYATFPFNVRVPAVGAVPARNVALTSNIIYGNLLFDIELANRGKFHPYIMFGAGGFNFQVQNSKRFNDGSGIGGLGFRYLVSPNVALNMNGAFHFTTGDALDAVLRKNNDAYFSGRLGLAFFKGGSPAGGVERDWFSEDELAPVEESDPFAEEDSSTENEFASRMEDLDNFDNGNNGNDGDMQEYIRLKSQVDEINQDIDSKEREIASLLAAVSESKQQIGSTKKSNAPPPPVVTGASFSRQYEQALQNFYLKRYTDAIQMFSDLIERFPTHSLSSSCHYWIGEANFHSGNYQAAIAALNKVLESARSMKKDDALLYLGQSYAQLNRKEDARQALTRLLQEYPGSEYASKAEALLSKM